MTTFAISSIALKIVHNWIRRSVKKLYNLRSKIIHKGEINIVKQKHVIDMRNIIRKCIIKLLEKYGELPDWKNEKQNLLDELDLKIL